RQFLDTSKLERDEQGLLIGSYDPFARSDLFASDGRVNYTGSFSRGISFGNRQDLILNSAFNLQLQGELGNGIQVRAAITDESLPIQPAGNTQQLREFDQIFIQLEKDRTKLTAGDYELRHPDGYFMRYFKKLEGATLLTQSGADAPEEGGRWTHHGSIAIARGQFVRQNIQPSEGNQGPYKLTGDGDQRFLIILSGTERIYLDGRLLTRGQDADYVIDYNLAELTFTTRQLITRDSRIIAEYEFADQRYLRTLYAAGTKFESGPWTAYANIYNQQDSKTATGDLILTPEQRQTLSEAGDNQSGILVPAIDTLDGRADQRATYVQIDTLVECGGEMREEQLLRLSNDEDALLFVATFTDVGVGMGRYELAPLNSANERSFRFVGLDPENCQPLGNYEPVIELVAPQQQQLFVLGGSYRSERGEIRVEGARSLLDLNRFSRLDGDDDRGTAARFDADYQLLGRGDSSWQLNWLGQFEYREATFQPINPYRSPEFFRDWNLSNRLGSTRPDASDEQLFKTGVRLNRANWGELAYTYGQFQREGSYQGRRQAANLSLNRAGWSVLATASLLDNEQEESQGTFWRPQARLAKRFKTLGDWQLSGEYTAERSEQRPLTIDTLLPFSFAFERIGLGIRSPEGKSYLVDLQARRRTDELPNGSANLVRATRADEVLLEGNYAPNKNLRFGGNFTYRSLDVTDQDLVNQRPSETFLGRLDISFKALNNSLRGQTAYTLGSGQEPRVEFQYLFVGPGLGQYIWQDSLYNNDGRIQPNEMEISPFPDIADYVRVSVFTNDFIRTDNAGLNQSLQWDPGRLWKDPKPWQKFLKRINLQSSLTVDRKTRQAEGIQTWNPLQLAISDTALVALSAGTRHGLFFNRGNPKYDIQISNRDIRRRQVLTTGYEASRQREWEFTFRYRPHTALSLNMGGSMGSREADSEQFNNKDFNIQSRSLEPEIDWQPGQDFRFNAQLILGREVNELTEGNGEQSLRREVKFEGNFRRWLQMRIRNVDINFTGESSSPVGFALLNGLQPGRNWLWNLSATQQLGRYLQLNLSYEGRQTGMAQTVHVGRAQVTALF
ncbi:MAG: hypothetical protein AAFU03_02415, partial [Bacteroidota bacterium]